MEKTGLYVPIITPFCKNGDVDYDGLKKAVKFVLRQKADGIYAVGGTSEFCLLTTEERKRILEVIIENAEGKEVIAQVGSQSTRESLDLAIHAERVGATYLSAVAPYYFNYSFKAIKEYFNEIANATKLKLMIYNASQSRTYSLDEMRELLRIENVYAMKFTSFNYYHLERLVKEFPSKKIFTGADEGFLAGQAVGAYGAIGTTFNFFADKYVMAKNLFNSGKVKEALEIINKINNVTEAMISDPSFIAGAKYIMTLKGLDILPDSRAPFSPIESEYKERLEKAYNENK